jgi:hypothetical protein
MGTEGGLELNGGVAEEGKGTEVGELPREGVPGGVMGLKKGNESFRDRLGAQTSSELAVSFVSVFLRVSFVYSFFNDCSGGDKGKYALGDDEGEGSIADVDIHPRSGIDSELLQKESERPDREQERTESELSVVEGGVERGLWRVLVEEERR